MSTNGNDPQPPSDTPPTGFDARRLAMYQTLQTVLGQPVADTLMNHLPSGGWGDVARRADIDTLRLHMNHKFEQIDERFDRVDQRFEQIDERFDRINERFDRMDQRFERMDERFDRVDQRFERVEVKIDNLAAMKRYIIGTGLSLAGLICALGIPALMLLAQR